MKTDEEATITPFAKPLYVMTKPWAQYAIWLATIVITWKKQKLYEEQPRHVMVLNCWRNS